jgi:hypothetical protein
MIRTHSAFPVLEMMSIVRMYYVRLQYLKSFTIETRSKYYVCYEWGCRCFVYWYLASFVCPYSIWGWISSC